MQHSNSAIIENAILSEADKVNSFYISKLSQFTKDFNAIISYLFSLHRQSSLNDQEVKSLVTINELDDNQDRATSMRRSLTELHLHAS